MIQNLFATNYSEAKDLFNPKMVYYVLFLGVFPSLIILKLKIVHNTFMLSCLSVLKVMVINFIVLGLILYVNYASFASIARTHRQLSHLIVPSNFIFAIISYAKNQLKSARKPLIHISDDAKSNSFWQQEHKKTIVVLVVGETARYDHFGMYGYEKQTTPNLSKKDLIHFKNTSSCGTSTAISLPCMFSHYARSDFSKDLSKNTENLLDIFKKVNFSVNWQDNNTGCKGLCARIKYTDLTTRIDKNICESGECFDEIFLQGLDQQIKKNPRNQLIIFHQKGSHGPSYYLRHPKKFEKFTPTCNTNQLQNCTKSEVNNSYDNTILYTDFVMGKIIDKLQVLSQSYNTALIYLSDHGESLGKNNLYLHGTPYFIAPTSQTHIPFFAWFSESFTMQFGIKKECLQDKQDDSFSHDNLFHSVIGLLNINSAYYQKEKDIFNSCKQVYN